MEKIFYVMHYLEEQKMTYATYMLFGEAKKYFSGKILNDYMTKFEYLSHFYNQLTFEEWRCCKFKERLRYKLKRMIIPIAIQEFLELVEKFKVAERLEHNTRVELDHLDSKKDIIKRNLIADHKINIGILDLNSVREAWSL
ncbi:hypothetical protein CR513_57415, partial [Mucuna pruriens]